MRCNGQSVTTRIEEFNAQFVIPEKSNVYIDASSPIADVKLWSKNIDAISLKLTPLYPEILLIITGRSISG